jgi:hypothetical protein
MPPELFRIECPTADSIASLSEHVEVAGIAAAEAFAYVNSRGIVEKVAQIHIVVTRSPATGMYEPKVNVIKR